MARSSYCSLGSAHGRATRQKVCMWADGSTMIPEFFFIEYYSAVSVKDVPYTIFYCHKLVFVVVHVERINYGDEWHVWMLNYSFLLYDLLCE